MLPTSPLRLRLHGTSASFSGNQTSDDRTRLHAGCLGETKCGFLAPSGFDALREEVRRHEEARPCHLVVLTAIFGCKDKLQQPQGPPPHLHSCFFAFVDEQSARYLRATAPRRVKASARRVGAWQLLVLRPPLAYASARRNSRVPKLLPFRLFARANFSLWCALRSISTHLHASPPSPPHPPELGALVVARPVSSP